MSREYLLRVDWDCCDSNVEKRLSVVDRIVVKGVVGPTNFSSRMSSFTGSPGTGSRDKKFGVKTCVGWLWLPPSTY